MRDWGAGDTGQNLNKQSTKAAKLEDQKSQVRKIRWNKNLQLKKVPIDVFQEIVVDLEDEKVSTHEVDFWNSFRVKFGSASSAGADLDKEQLLVREGQGGDHAESSLDYGE